MYGNHGVGQTGRSKGSRLTRATTRASGLSSELLTPESETARRSMQARRPQASEYSIQPTHTPTGVGKTGTDASGRKGMPKLPDWVRAATTLQDESVIAELVASPSSVKSDYYDALVKKDSHLIDFGVVPACAVPKMKWNANRIATDEMEKLYSWEVTQSPVTEKSDTEPDKENRVELTVINRVSGRTVQMSLDRSEIKCFDHLITGVTDAVFTHTYSKGTINAKVVNSVIRSVMSAVAETFGPLQVGAQVADIATFLLLDSQASTQEVWKELGLDELRKHRAPQALEDSSEMRHRATVVPSVKKARL